MVGLGCESMAVGPHGLRSGCLGLVVALWQQMLESAVWLSSGLKLASVRADVGRAVGDGGGENRTGQDRTLPGTVRSNADGPDCD